MSEEQRGDAPDPSALRAETDEGLINGGCTGPAAGVAAPYAAAGKAFTNWFNECVRRLTNPTLMLGTKLARVVELHRDGRLEVEIETEALEPERQFVAFEAKYLDQLVRKIAAIGL